MNLTFLITFLIGWVVGSFIGSVVAIWLHYGSLERSAETDDAE